MIIATIPSSKSKIGLKAWVLVAIDPKTSIIKDYQYLFGISVFTNFKDLKSMKNKYIEDYSKKDFPNDFVYKAHINMIEYYKEEYNGSINQVC